MKTKEFALEILLRTQSRPLRLVHFFSTMEEAMEAGSKRLDMSYRYFDGFVVDRSGKALAFRGRTERIWTIYGEPRSVQRFYSNGIWWDGVFRWENGKMKSCLFPSDPILIKQKPGIMRHKYSLRNPSFRDQLQQDYDDLDLREEMR